MGPSGVGVETLLDKWEAAWPDDVQQMLARFSFCFNRSQNATIIQQDKERYLGREPLFPLTDSLGRRSYYFEDYTYDDDLFAQANLAIDRAIAARPHRLDYRMYKIDAMLAYEKGEPDMSLQQLKALADKEFKDHTPWEYEGMPGVDREQFKAFMQDYCVTLFRLGTETSAQAFKSFSEYLLGYCKDEPLYLDNLGSYYLVKKDYKKAQKYFDQVLRKHPGDMTALSNGILMARARKEVKLEKKYLALMAKHGETEQDRNSAQVRLDAYSQGK